MTVIDCSTAAPGKILVVGGYAILFDPIQRGFAVASQARIYSKCEIEFESISEDDNLSPLETIGFLVHIIPEQFKKDSSTYQVTYSLSDGVVKVELLPNGDDNQKINPQLRSAIASAISFCFGSHSHMNSIKIGSITIRVLAHNDFYSQSSHIIAKRVPQRKQSVVAALNDILTNKNTFESLDGDNENSSVLDIPKTGLGSSSAVSTSVISSILYAWYKMMKSINKSKFNLSDGQLFKIIVHRLSSISHFLAQGKLGSGFDVSVAVYGTQIFSPIKNSELLKEKINSIIKLDIADTKNDTKNKIVNVDSIKLFKLVYEDLLELNQTNVNNVKVSSVFDIKVETSTFFNRGFPPGIKLILFDVSVGSSTPHMVKNVLEVLQKIKGKTNIDVEGINKEILNVWLDLTSANEDTIYYLSKISQLSVSHPKEYLLVLKRLAGTNIYHHYSNHNSNDSINSLNSPVDISIIEQDISTSFLNLKESFENVLSSFKILSRLSGTEIVPTEIFALLNLIKLNSNGVLSTGVPGAGGYDAFFVLFLDPLYEYDENTNKIVRAQQGDDKFRDRIINISTQVNEFITKSKFAAFSNINEDESSSSSDIPTIVNPFKLINFVVPLKSGLNKAVDESADGLLIDTLWPIN